MPDISGKPFLIHVFVISFSRRDNTVVAKNESHQLELVINKIFSAK